MTLQDLQNLVNNQRRDITESFVSNDEITDYLNEGLRKVNTTNDWEFTLTAQVFPVYATSAWYSLSSKLSATDFKMPYDMISINATAAPIDTYKFTLVTQKDFDKLYRESLNLYSINSDNLGIKTSFGNGYVALQYYSYNMAQTSAGSMLMRLSVSDDTPLMPETYQDMLVDYALSRCFKKEGMYDDYKIAYNDFLVRLKSMQGDFIKESVRPLRRMVMGSQYGSGDGQVISKSNIFGM
jgi:hypothetical protein